MGPESLRTAWPVRHTSDADTARDDYNANQHPDVAVGGSASNSLVLALRCKEWGQGRATSTGQPASNGILSKISIY